jgi:hypothetical protein
LMPVTIARVTAGSAPSRRSSARLCLWSVTYLRCETEPLLCRQGVLQFTPVAVQCTLAHTQSTHYRNM